MFPSLAGYYDEKSAVLISDAAINAVLDTTASGNFVGACTLPLASDSACVDAGTTTGAPARDRELEPRDATPDIGPDELVE